MGKLNIVSDSIVAERRTVPIPPLVIINARAMTELISIEDAIQLVRTSMRDFSAGLVDAPQRWSMPINREGALAFMPGAMPTQKRFGAKILSLFTATNDHADIPGHQGLMLLFDMDNGRPLSVVDANSLTRLRTAAASAVATDLLARPQSRSLALIGCGEQAQWHLHALRQIRAISEVRVWSRSMTKAEAFARDNDMQDVTFIPCETVQQAVDGADIICTLTRSPAPVIQADWLSPGQHLNLVGSSTRHSREVDDATVALGRFVADSRAHALLEGGELLSAIASGLVTKRHIHAEIGEIIDGRAEGRTDDDMITLYKSLGHVTQDLAVAQAAHERAERSEHTIWVAW